MSTSTSGGAMRDKTEKGKSPLPSDEQDSPQPERMTTPGEEAGQTIEEGRGPSQAEGDRDASAE